MALAAGMRLGVYEITALIGAGGMGEVYRARDTRLNRDVAMKVLPELFAEDPDRLARFKREAQVLASLNHPNIAAIHGLEESCGITALVMELVEGETLDQRIRRPEGLRLPADGGGRPSGLPLDEALPIARQIAEALEAAHEHGVIHRDLKPANVKVRPDGTVKVLDFGLAKAFGPAEAGHYVQQGGAGAAGLSMSPTITSPAATRIGVILGTAAYMSPEQARGKAVDKRSDIWSFGCVLYEMLTGRRAFDGEEVTDLLARIIEREPDYTAIPSAVPPAIRRLLRRCLEKDRRQRLPDIGVARLEIDEALAAPAGVEAAAAPASPRATRERWGWMAALVVTTLATAAAVWSLKPEPPPESRPTARFSYTLPPNQTFRNNGRPVVAISPDGRQFVYNAQGGLYLRSMDGLNARLIAGTEENLTSPFFSRDGQWIGFFSLADTQLKKVSVAGGAAVTLAKATNPFGASWSADNTIVFGQPEGIMRVSANGGTPELLVATEKGEQVHGPQMLPDGQWVLFSLTRELGETRWNVAEIVAQSLASGERKVLWRGGSDAQYVPSGHLIYALDDALFAVPFDLERLEVSGGPVPLLAGLQRALTPATQSATAHYGVSDGGTLVHVPGAPTVAQARTLVWVDRSGGEEAIAAPPRAYVHPRISPDGAQVALDVREQEDDIWIWSLARSTLTRLTFDPGLDRVPVWTPDGRRIVFSSQRAGVPNLFWQAADGAGAAERLTESPNVQLPSSVSADGTRLVFEEQGTATNADVHILPLAGQRRATPLVATTFTERNGELSADGRWLAYESRESGRDEVYVRPFPGVDVGQWQLSTDGGTQPLWAPDSREELYYVNPDGGIMAVPIQPGPSFIAGNPQMMVDGPFATILPGVNGRMYDVSRDGQRFLMVKPVESAQQEAPPPQIIVVQNWFEELKRLAPAR